MALPALRGHHDARRRLVRAVVAGQIPQSVLLHGPAGVGKERLALWAAQLIVCNAPGPDGPCDTCLSCRLATRLEHPDIHWFFPLPRPEGASADRLREKLEEARAEELRLRRADPHRVPAFGRAPAHFLAAVQTIQQAASLRPAMSRRSVFVVGDAELMVPQESSPEAANAFLKLLEEPPPDTFLLLTSSRPDALLPTIRSRVLPLRVGPLERAEVEAFLREAMSLDGADAAAVGALSRGAIGRALRLAPTGGKPGPLGEERERARALLQAALSPTAVPRFAAACEQAPVGGRGAFSELLDALAEWLADLLAVVSGAEPAASDADGLAFLSRIAEQHAPHPLGVAAALQAVGDAQELAQGNVNPQLLLASLLQRMQQALLRAPVAR